MIVGPSTRSLYSTQLSGESCVNVTVRRSKLSSAPVLANSELTCCSSPQLTGGFSSGGGVGM
jgi:hypothetical protein